MTEESLHVAVIDIGSLTNLGWAIDGPSVIKSGTDIDLCIEAFASAMKMGPLALGFEAPMFLLTEGSDATWTRPAKATAIVHSRLRQGRAYSPRRWYRSLHP